MIRRTVFLLLLGGYVGLMPILAGSLASRPVAVKAGYVPSGDVLKIVAGEYRTLFADWTVVRTLFYFGTIFDLNQRNIVARPEYEQMYNNLVQALKLDPYNQDISYFSQAVFTWDVGRAKETNKLLDYGMKYRTWDWQLPFWAGFNSAYFMKDYQAAAGYFKKAAELSGNSLFTRLAARYFHEAGDDQLGIAFLETMIKSAKDDRVRKVYQTRLDALVAASQLRQAVAVYRQKYSRMPASLEDLVSAGVLNALPADPYGGSFYLDADGQVRTTSKFAFGNFGADSTDGTVEKSGTDKN